MVRDYLKFGPVHRLHVAIVPTVLGRGIRLWDDLRSLETGYAVRSETAESEPSTSRFSASVQAKRQIIDDPKDRQRPKLALRSRSYGELGREGRLGPPMP